MRPLVKSAAKTVGGISRRSSAGSSAVASVAGMTTCALNVEGECGTEKSSARAPVCGTLGAVAAGALLSCVDVKLLALVVLEVASRFCAASRCPGCVSPGAATVGGGTHDARAVPVGLESVSAS